MKRWALHTPRIVARFATDWRNVATLIAAVLVALIAYVVLEGASERQQALDAAIAASRSNVDIADRATRRIDLLSKQIAELKTAADDATGQRIAQQAESMAQIAALSEQVRSLGGKPVVTVTVPGPVRVVPVPVPTTATPTTTTSTARTSTSTSSTTAPRANVPNLVTTTTATRNTTTTRPKSTTTTTRK